MNIDLVVAQIVNGLGNGLIYFLVAFGLALIFGLQDFVNFSHGAFYILGFYVAYSVASLSGSYWVALLVGPLAAAAAGLLVESTLLRPLYSHGHNLQILGTFALSIIVMELVTLIWGPSSHIIQPPAILDGSTHVGLYALPNFRIFVIGLTLALALAMILLLDKSRFGLVLRASAEDGPTSSALGVNVRRVFTATFALGCGLAGLAGVLSGPIRSFTPNTAAEVMGISFVIVVVGGLTDVRRILGAALGVGVIQSVTIILWSEGGALVPYLLMTAGLLFGRLQFAGGR